MKLLHPFKIAYNNLRINKRRSFLTMLGIIIGTLSVVFVMSVGAGAQSLILNQIQQRGTDQIAILAGASEENGPPAQAMGIVITTLTYEDGLALLNKKNVQHLEAVAGYISGNDILRWQNEEVSATYTGTTASYQVVEKIKMGSGRFFTKAEERGDSNLMVLGSKVAEEIFGNQDPVGEFVRLKNQRFKVIGVIAPVGTNAFEDPDSQVLIPLRVAQRKMLGVRHVSFLRAQVEDEKYLRETIEEVRQTLIERHDDEDFSVRNVADALEIFGNITNAMKFFLVAIAAVALFVGGVGIMNIMLIAVKEKTREIGLRKSVGARANDIMAQFLIETFFLALVGTVIGVILGLLISLIIALVVKNIIGYDYDFVVSPVVIIISFVIAILIGFFFGIVPAKKAAELSPIDALRYE